MGKLESQFSTASLSTLAEASEAARLQTDLIRKTGIVAIVPSNGSPLVLNSTRAHLSLDEQCVSDQLFLGAHLRKTLLH